MDGEDDLREQILQVEADLEELTDAVDRCRKIILISKAIIAAGATLILAIALGGVGFDPVVLIGSIAAVIGGTVVFGSNTSTLKQTAAAIKAAEVHRTELISRIDLLVVGDDNSRVLMHVAPNPHLQLGLRFQQTIFKAAAPERRRTNRIEARGAPDHPR
jgi:hypothetical protein